VLDALGILFGGFGRDADGGEHGDHQTVPGADLIRQRLAFRREENAAIGLGCREALALQPADGFDGGGMADAEAARDIGRAGFAAAGQQVGDQLGVILQQGVRLREAGLAEASGLGGFSRHRGWGFRKCERGQGGASPGSHENLGGFYTVFKLDESVAKATYWSGMNTRLETADLSLADVHGSVRAPVGAQRWRRWLAAFGPGYIIAVGYMDPGNWATDLAAGSAYGYALLAVVLLASVMAMVLQALSAWLGLASGRDLAQLTRSAVSPFWGGVLWLFAQSAIIACDVAEVIGGAIALNLLFHIPLMLGAVLTILDAFVVLMLLRWGMRLLEAAVIGLSTVIAVSLFIEIVMARPAVAPILAGLAPHLGLLDNPGMLYIGVGIIGATVMPHNLYLHSALVQTRAVEGGEAARKNAIFWALVDSSVALVFAFLVNAAILVMAGSVFHTHGETNVQDLGQAYALISPILGNHAAAVIFAVALLGAGLNATVTGTLAGQVVMEGFLRMHLPVAVRRVLTRGLAVLPVLGVMVVAGPAAVNGLLVLSQVVLSLQLPFAMLPLMFFVVRLKRLRPPLWLRSFGWVVTGLILMFNAALLWSLI
jgi:manganese transport protein